MTEKEKQEKELMRRLKKLADGKVNDAVKLAFREEEDLSWLDELDLSNLAELKKGDKGVEMKFLDPLRVIAMMRELMSGGGEQGMQDLLRALDRTAGGDEKL